MKTREWDDPRIDLPDSARCHETAVRSGDRLLNGCAACLRGILVRNLQRERKNRMTLHTHAAACHLHAAAKGKQAAALRNGAFRRFPVVEDRNTKKRTGVRSVQVNPIPAGVLDRVGGAFPDCQSEQRPD